MELLQLQEIVEFSNLGTISKAAEKLYVSQPSITRDMQKLEAEVGYPLFERRKNSLKLNSNGEAFVKEAIKVLNQMKDFEGFIQNYRKRLTTFSIGSCAPLPLQQLLTKATDFFTGYRVEGEIKDIDSLIKGVLDKTYSLIVLPYIIKDDSLVNIHYGFEKLYVQIPKSNPLAYKSSISMTELKDQDILLFKDIGFWMDYVEKCISDKSHIIFTENRRTFEQLANATSLINFVTDLRYAKYGEMNVVPLNDIAAVAQYYLVYRRDSPKAYSEFVDGVIREGGFKLNEM